VTTTESSTDKNMTSPDRRRRLVQLAYRLLFNREDAEDAVQNALIQAQWHDHQLSDPEKHWTWLCRIVVRGCLQFRRAESRRIAHHAKSVAHIPPVVPERFATDRQHETGLVRRAIEQLPEKQRVAITLRHLQEMPYDDIAEIMGVSNSTVRVHVRTARETLRKVIAKINADTDR
jgi:RNA polymerase sigma-70 factor, ECF subfamily